MDDGFSCHNLAISSANRPLPSITMMGRLWRTLCNTSLLAIEPPLISTATEGQPAESVFANSYIVSVSPPHLSVSTRTKCEWFGSSGTPGTLALPLMPVDLPGYVTFPAGATPNRVDLSCCSATA